MNRNLKRHKLLKILSEQYEKTNLDKDNVWGVSFEMIFKEMKCDDKKLQLITSTLYDSKEIGYHNAHKITGLYLTHPGFKSFSDKKYIKQNRLILIKWISYFGAVTLFIIAIYKFINSLDVD